MMLLSASLPFDCSLLSALLSPLSPPCFPSSFPNFISHFLSLIYIYIYIHVFVQIETFGWLLFLVVKLRWSDVRNSLRDCFVILINVTYYILENAAEIPDANIVSTPETNAFHAMASWCGIRLSLLECFACMHSIYMPPTPVFLFFFFLEFYSLYTVI